MAPIDAIAEAISIAQPAWNLPDQLRELQACLGTYQKLVETLREKDFDYNRVSDEERKGIMQMTSAISKGLKSGQNAEWLSEGQKKTLDRIVQEVDRIEVRIADSYGSGAYGTGQQENV